MTMGIEHVHGGTATGERCVGPVRWLRTANYRKLQQLYEITEYDHGTPTARREEWRDVEVVDGEPVPPTTREG